MQGHVIVDGSNIATEGRTQPSLLQLTEAVAAFMREFPAVKVTVVVDATFGHRISKKEQIEFNEAIDNNELVAPPAGAIGRGDAFVLSIADKVQGTVLSNDSYQEFHGKYDWLFTEGRLIGGKPVPHVGWVFVERLPVRGVASRRATRKHAESKHAPALKTAARTTSQPSPSPLPYVPPVPTAPPAARKVRTSNEVAPFLEFVEKHPVGSGVKAVVEGYSAHGATVSVGDVIGYVPLRLLATPPPRSARDLLKIGDTVSLVVAGYTPARRSVELGLASVVPTAKKTPSKATVKKMVIKKSAPSGTVKKAAKKAAKGESSSRKATSTRKGGSARKTPSAAPTPARAPRKR